jgi:putative oxidoreductase
MTAAVPATVPPPTTTRRSPLLAVLAWSAQLTVAVILAQTLVFKFTYAPETRYIFEARGGRPAATAVGLAELLCVGLLLVPRTAAVGGLLSLAVIGGALFTHLTVLGIQVQNPDTGEWDGGLLFGLAVAVAVGSLAVLAVRWKQLPLIGRLVLRAGV